MKIELNVSVPSALIVLCGGASAALVAKNLFSAVSMQLTIVLVVWFVLMLIACVCLGSFSVFKPKCRIATRFESLSLLIINCIGFGLSVSLLRGNPYLVDALPEVARIFMCVAGFTEIGRLYASWRKPNVLECSTATV